MFDKNRYKSTIGFTDMLFNVLVGFAFLFIVAFLLIKPESKKEDFERKAEFVIVMEWDHDQPDDIDLYVQDPTENKVHFRLPIINFMYLDKDDLGFANDVVTNVDGTVQKVNINREVVTIRGIIPGEYIVNAHYYSSREWTRMGQLATNVGVVPEVSSEKVYNKNNQGHYSLAVGEAEFFGSNVWEQIITWTPILLYIAPYMDIVHWQKFDVRTYLPHIFLLVLIFIVKLS